MHSGSPSDKATIGKPIPDMGPGFRRCRQNNEITSAS